LIALFDGSASPANFCFWVRRPTDLRLRPPRSHYQACVCTCARLCLFSNSREIRPSIAYTRYPRPIAHTPYGTYAMTYDVRYTAYGHSISHVRVLFDVRTQRRRALHFLGPRRTQGVGRSQQTSPRAICIAALFYFSGKRSGERPQKELGSLRHASARTSD
jgi:hypothetical protein